MQCFRSVVIFACFCCATRVLRNNFLSENKSICSGMVLFFLEIAGTRQCQDGTSPTNSGGQEITDCAHNQHFS